MIKCLGKKILFLAFMMVSYDSLLARDPMGELANYSLDRSQSRTSNVIKSGKLKIEVGSHIPDHEAGDVYLAGFEFKLRVAMAGNQNGTETVLVDKLYFGQDFWTQLRRDKIVETASFKAKHAGFGNATDLSGQTYNHCDIVDFYDIETEGHSFLATIAWSLAQQLEQQGLMSKDEFEGDSYIENMQFHTYICQGVPSLGAVKIDVTGKTRGFNYKLGFDYKP